MPDEPECRNREVELNTHPPKRRSATVTAREQKAKRSASQMIKDCYSSNQTANLEASCEANEPHMEVSWQVQCICNMHVYIRMHM